MFTAYHYKMEFIKDIKRLVKKLDNSSHVFGIIAIVHLIVMLVVPEAFEVRDDFSAIMLMISCINTSSFMTVLIIKRKLNKILKEN